MADIASDVPLAQSLADHLAAVIATGGAAKGAGISQGQHQSLSQTLLGLHAQDVARALASAAPAPAASKGQQAPLGHQARAGAPQVTNPGGFAQAGAGQHTNTVAGNPRRGQAYGEEVDHLGRLIHVYPNGLRVVVHHDALAGNLSGALQNAAIGAGGVSPGLSY